MNWIINDDHSETIITAKRMITSLNKDKLVDTLPETCVLFFCKGALDYLCDNYKTKTIFQELPRFLGSTSCFSVEGYENICFMHGGYGAPQAVDTIETVVNMGVKRIIAVGLCGVFVPNISLGDIIIPIKAYIEEGTSLHYYSNIKYSQPTKSLYNEVLSYFNSECVTHTAPIISTDAVYRQTFQKEQKWREQGCIGIDMEVSAIFSVSAYLKIDAVAIMLASDIHPLHKDDEAWEWTLSRDMRFQYISRCIEFILHLETG